MPQLKVLIAEDHQHIREITLFNLEHYGRFEFVTVGHGDAAVGALLKDQFDVVLMDIRMPVMDGLEATRRIRQFSTVPIIAVSAYDDALTRQRAKEAGVNQFFAKPVDFGQLAIAIRNLTQKQGTDSLNERVANIKRLIDQHNRRLQVLKERQAQMGLETAPSVITEIEDIEARISELQGLLSE